VGAPHERERDSCWTLDSRVREVQGSGAENLCARALPLRLGGRWTQQSSPPEGVSGMALRR
jgi:hypothetical protein